MKTRYPILAAVLFAASIQAQTTISIDAAADRHAIDPRIYGQNFATTAQIQDLELPVNRNGGNSTTRYNWEQNSSNRANDWYFESLEGDSHTAGGDVDAFIQSTRNGGAQPMITIPMIGWVAKIGPSPGYARKCSYSVALYGAQKSTDWQWMPDCGNGVRLSDGTEILNNNPEDANLAVQPSFQAPWIQHLRTQWGTAAAGGVKYYILDNEYSLWQSTHRDVKPVGPNMEEIRDRIQAYGSMVRANEPDAVIVAPEEWGWLGAKLSGYDQQWASAHSQWSDTPDRVAHAGKDYVPWLLSELKKYEYSTGRRVLDIFTMHIYPQSGEALSLAGDATRQALRNRSTRSLWDPAYRDESWQDDYIYLIPHMRQWLDDNYPGLQTGITEYNWGAEEHINGAVTQADILGIFGRERLNLATRWGTFATGDFGYNAYRMFRNYNGSHGKFGDISVRAQAPTPDTIASFAAVRSSDGALTVMLINKSGSTQNVTLNLANYTPSGSAQRWKLDAANSITAGSALPISASTAISLPATSITLLVIPGTTDVVAPAIAVTGSTRAAGGTWSFNGTASDPGGSISSVKYKVSGTGGATGTAAGTSSWSVSSIAAPNCYAAITFTAFDAAGNSTDILRALGTSITPSTATFGKNATSSSFAVKAPAGCAWGASTTSSFVTINAGSGTADGTVSFSLAQNNTGVSRSASITVAGQTFAITQGIVNVATGDFSGDGAADIVLRNYSNGSNAVWTMNGTALQSIVDLPALPNTNYRFEGTSDFNADGKTDIVLRNYATGQDALWLLNGTSLQAIVDLPALPALNYHFEGTADFNGDSKPDIMLRNYVTGQNALWLMNGTSLLSIVDLPALTNVNYRFESAADFNSDGKPDIVLRNYATGQNAVWLMNGTSLLSIVDLPALPNTQYRIDALGDFNNDQKTDIVLRNYSTGQNAVWLMNGTTLVSIADLPALPNVSYEINGPR
jgi:hypothetical protein